VSIDISLNNVISKITNGSVACCCTNQLAISFCGGRPARSKNALRTRCCTGNEEAALCGTQVTTDETKLSIIFCLLFDQRGDTITLEFPKRVNCQLFGRQLLVKK